MKPGFAEPVLDAQQAFRALMDAMARPGRIGRCEKLTECPANLMPSAAAALLCLADAETRVWTDAGEEARGWIAFHTGALLVDEPAAAQFLLATAAMPPLATLNPGTDEAPQESATLILQVSALHAGAGWRLTGPGIAAEHHLSVAGLPRDFCAQWTANHAGFPCGVDLVLACGTEIAALPRTTRIEEAG